MLKYISRAREESKGKAMQTRNLVNQVFRIDKGIIAVERRH